MTTDVEIREATERDLGQVARVLRAANAEYRNVPPAPFYVAYLANVLELRGRLGAATLFVAEAAEAKIVAAITLFPDASDEGWGWPSGWSGIRAAAVHPSARGLGIGRKLTETCVARARELGAEAVGLHTAPFMTAAIRLYESIGFRRAPEFDRDAYALMAIPPLDPPIAALAYALELRGGKTRPQGGDIARPSTHQLQDANRNAPWQCSATADDIAVSTTRSSRRAG